MELLKTFKTFIARGKQPEAPEEVVQASASTALSSDSPVDSAGPSNEQVVTPPQQPQDVLPALGPSDYGIAPRTARTDERPPQQQDRQHTLPAPGLLFSSSDVRGHDLPPTTNFFPGAHGLTFNNPIMAERFQVFNSQTPLVIQVLEEERIPDSGHDSVVRSPPPSCHPGTRRTLQGEITSWMSRNDRRSRMIWVLGPAGVGKSAIAQTIAERYGDGVQLGAAFFFSRLNHRNNPFRVFPTIAHQLACRHADYRQIVTQTLAHDPRVHEKSLRTQFQELIIKPFQVIAAYQPDRLEHPLLMIIDGLDECDGEEEQCELLQLIGGHVRTVKHFPLLWLVCSRPEWHLKSLVYHPDFVDICWHKKLSVDDSEAQDDVYRFLFDGLDSIRWKYRDRLEESWPPEAKVRKLATITSGLFALASTSLKFVGDRSVNDPEGQLDACIEIISNPDNAPNPSNLLRALDALYIRILSDIPKDILSTTMRVLGFSIFVRSHQLSAQVQANFLHLDQTTFYRSLQKLHSVLDIPEPEEAMSKPLAFYHNSFGEFLRDSRRSDIYCLSESKVNQDLDHCALQWYSYTTHLTGSKPATFLPIRWITSDHLAIHNTLREFSSHVLIFSHSE